MHFHYNRVNLVCDENFLITLTVQAFSFNFIIFNFAET